MPKFLQNLRVKPKDEPKDKIKVKRYFELKSFKPGENLKDSLSELINISDKIFIGYDKVDNRLEYFTLETDEEQNDRLAIYNESLTRYNEWYEKHKEDIEFTKQQKEELAKKSKLAILKELEAKREVLLQELTIAELEIESEKDRLKEEHDILV